MNTQTRTDAGGSGDELRRAAAPLVEYMRKNCSPHAAAIVTQTRADVFEGEAGVPFPKDGDEDEGARKTEDSENRSTVTIVVSGERADALARGFLETVRESNRRDLSRSGHGCVCTVVAYSVHGERMEIEGYGRNGLSVCDERGSVEVY